MNKTNIRIGDILVRNKKLDKDFFDKRICLANLPIKVKSITHCGSRAGNRSTYGCCSEDVCPGRINENSHGSFDGCFGHNSSSCLLVEKEQDWDE